MSNQEGKSQDTQLLEEDWDVLGWQASDAGVESPVRAPRASPERVAIHFRSSPLELAPEVLSFGQQHVLLRYLQTACTLIESCFSSVENLSVEVEHDPDGGEQWLVLSITIQGETEDILDQYQSYTHQWVSHVLWPERNKIRLSYDIV